MYLGDFMGLGRPLKWLLALALIIGAAFATGYAIKGC